MQLCFYSCQKKILKCKKRLLLSCIHHFNSDFINNMDQIRNMLTMPDKSNVITTLPQSISSVLFVQVCLATNISFARRQ